MRENEILSLWLQVQPENVGRPRIKSRRILRRGASRKLLRLDCLPPSGSGLPGQRMNASKKLELPPTRKDDLKAPGKKSGTAIKKEKPKHMPPKIKGAELWRDCPAEFLSAARAGLVSGRLSIQSPGPGLLLKEIRHDNYARETEVPAISKKIDSSPRNLPNTLAKKRRTFPSTLRLRSGQAGFPRQASEQVGTGPKPKGKSK